MAKMTSKEWGEYIKRNLDKGRERSEFLLLFMPRAIPVSIIIGIIASLITIKFWGFKEYARMMLQLIMGVTIATTVIATAVRRLEKKLGRE